VRVHTLTAEEKGAWVDDINARMAALAPIERRAFLQRGGCLSLQPYSRPLRRLLVRPGY
jgi:hypothetical protein